MAEDTDGVEQPLLWRVYQELLGFLDDPSKVDEKGFGKFEVSGDFSQMLADRLGTKKHRIGQALDRLKSEELDAYYTRSGGRGNPFQRFVKPGAEDRVAAAAGLTRAPLPTIPVPTPDPDDGETPSVIPPGSMEVNDPAQFHRLWVDLSAQLEEYLERAETAERSLEEEREAHTRTKEELEAARAEPKAVFVLPAELAKHLKEE